MSVRVPALLAAFCIELALLPAARAQDPGSLLGSDLHATSLASGENVVFVSDGYPADEKDNFLADAKAMAAHTDMDASAAPLRASKLFNFHYVFVPSADRGAPFAAGAAAGNTPFKSTLGTDGLMHADDAAADSAAAKYAPDVDVVVIIARFADGAGPGPSTIRANSDIRSSGSRVRTPRDCDGAFVHELGHAIFSLGDEYGGAAGPIPDDQKRSLGVFPNLTFDASGARWQAIVAGAVPGGANFDAGIWHPTSSCRMGDGCWNADCAFCPVCLAQMHGVPTSKPGAPKIDGPSGSVSGEVVARLEPGPGAPATSYYVVVEESDDGTGWRQVSATRGEPRAPVDLGALPAGHYEIQVCATNALGDSSWSSGEFDVTGSAAPPSRPVEPPPSGARVGLAEALGALASSE